MEKLLIREDFEKLSPNEKVHLIHRGEIKHYRFVGFNPVDKEMILLVNDASHSDVAAYRLPNVLQRKNLVFVKDYNSVEVGKIMREQLYHMIKTIEEIYIQQNRNHGK